MVKDFLSKLVVEGGRVFWTAVEAAAGYIAAVNIPEDLFDFTGEYEPFVIGAIGVAVAAIATKLKEIARRRLTPEPLVPIVILDDDFEGLEPPPEDAE